jgi:predicted esterase
MLRCLLCLLLAGFVRAEAAPSNDLESHFAKGTAEAPSPEWAKTTFASPAEAEKAISLAWQAYRKGAEARGEQNTIAPQPTPLEQIAAMPENQRPKLVPSELTADGKTMPYFLMAKGKKPDKGWPLVIALHGGGGTAEKLSGPHEWPVNTSEWRAQMMLFERIYPSDAMYFIPRMADDHDGRWYYDYCQKIYDQVIRRAILFRDVDPNRIYITGISEGGYTAYRLPANRPDRFAAACSMAAAEPLENAPPENLRNTPFRCGIGEQDNGFGRITLARNFFAKLDDLQKADPKGYVHFFDAQAGRGHGIDYAPGPKWMVTYSRDPRPKTIVWTVQKLHNTLDLRNNWISLAEAPATLPANLDATITGNTVSIHANPGLKVRLFLDDKLVDLSQPVKVVMNGKEVFNATAPRNLATIVETLESRGDPKLVYSAEVSLSS